MIKNCTSRLTSRSYKYVLLTESGESANDAAMLSNDITIPENNPDKYVLYKDFDKIPVGTYILKDNSDDKILFLSEAVFNKNIKVT